MSLNPLQSEVKLIEANNIHVKSTTIIINSMMMFIVFKRIALNACDSYHSY